MTVRRTSRITVALLLLALLLVGTWLAEAEHTPSSTGTQLVSNANATQELSRLQSIAHPPTSFAALMSMAYR